MTLRLPLLFGSALLAATLSAASVWAHHDDEWAIFPPATPYVPEAGGHVRYVPYYPGYCKPHNHGLFHRGRPDMCGGFGMDWDMSVGGYNPGDYGIYTGAPSDEEMLLHLGGNNGPYVPSRNVPDFIDLYQGAASPAPGYLPHH